MNFRTVLAVVLSVLILVLFYALKPVLFPDSYNQKFQSQSEESKEQIIEHKDESVFLDDFISKTEKQSNEKFSNSNFDVVFNPFGNIKSIKLKKYKETNSDQELQMLLDTDKNKRYGIDFNFFIKDLYFKKVSENAKNINFESSFEDKKSNTYTIEKHYSFSNKGYLIKLKINLESSNIKNIFPISNNNLAYKMTLAPQIGPNFLKLDNRNDFRKFFYYDKKLHKLGNSSKSLDKQWSYTGVQGKYFLFAISPSFKAANTKFISSFYDSKPLTSLSFGRPVIQETKKTDVYYMYVGPNIKKELAKFNNQSDNDFGLSAYNFDKIVSGSILMWLENILKYILIFINSIINNMGLSIIILTIIVKIVLLPLNINASVSSFKMKKLNPKIEKIREKYKDEPLKIQGEMNKLYSKEGVSMLGGCFPMLMQFPIFIAMYNLFNYHFELRGASFIPGWIEDLSSPEYIMHFDFSLPILGWQDLRLLPIIYMLSQLTSGFITMKQTPQSASASQMKMMTYGIPLVFFFILYDVPSGLLVYWISQNILTVVQQTVVLNPVFIGKIIESKENKKKAVKKNEKKIRR